jgi:hypothetical protein
MAMRKVSEKCRANFFYHELPLVKTGASMLVYGGVNMVRIKEKGAVGSIPE